MALETSRSRRADGITSADAPCSDSCQIAISKANTARFMTGATSGAQPESQPKLQSQDVAEPEQELQPHNDRDQLNDRLNVSNSIPRTPEAGFPEFPVLTPA